MIEFHPQIARQSEYTIPDFVVLDTGVGEEGLDIGGFEVGGEVEDDQLFAVEVVLGQDEQVLTEGEVVAGGEGLVAGREGDRV